MPVKVDPSIRRVVIGNFHFPLGVYPVEDMTPKAGYAMNFEPADGGEEGEWEEWPDRYAYDVVLSAERLPAFARTIFSLFDGRVYPILDVLGQDGYREVDPYISYELVGLDRFFDGVREYADYLFEDGMCGFGVMSEEPFLYVFFDEHKIATIRAAPVLKERVERALAAFDLEQTEGAAGADASAHEHRTVLVLPADNPSMLGPDEVLERLKDHWRLVLNVDPDANVDDEGKELGTTAWRGVLRCQFTDGPAKYAEVVFDADNLRQAEEVAMSAAETLIEKEQGVWEDTLTVLMDRLRPEQLAQVLGQAGVRAEPKRKSARPKAKAKASGSGAGPAQEPDQIPAAGRVYIARWLA